MKIERTRKTLVMLEILIILIISTNFAFAVPNPPTNVNASLSGISLTINWTKSTSVNVTQYRVDIYNNSGTVKSTITAKVDANTTSTTVKVPSIPDCYKAHVRSMEGQNLSPGTVSNMVCNMIVSPGTIPPRSITGLKVVSYAKDYINWTWKNPSDKDFSSVMVYIDGVFQTNVSSGNSYNATGLSHGNKHSIGTHTVDTSRNINMTWVNNTKKTAPDIIRFVTIGDVHIGGNNTPPSYTNGLANFTRAINFINNMTNVDFVVQMGDIVDNTSVANFLVANSILHTLTKPYYVVEGNHDIGSPSGANFRKYIGPTNNTIPDFNGYQLIFPGVDNDGSSYRWMFNYSTVNKNKPTVVFNHGPVKPNPKSNITDCVKSWDGNNSAYYGYACSMSPELDNFTSLLGVYDGHVHIGTHKKINGTLYVTEDNLGGAGPTSPYIGYTVIQNRTVTYSRILY